MQQLNREITTAVVLAGGRGTRLGAHTRDRPKPLLEVAGRALLLRQLTVLEELGFERAVVVIGHLGDQIREATNRWRELGELASMELAFTVQDPPLGTAHAFGCAERHLANGPCLLVLGDLLFDHEAIRTLRATADREQVDTVVAVHPVADASAGAEVVVRGNSDEVVEIIEKPLPGNGSCLNNTGLYLLPSGAAALCRKLSLSPRGEYELPDLIARLIVSGRRVCAARVPPPLHVGTPAELRDAESRLSAGPGSASATKAGAEV